MSDRWGDVDGWERGLDLFMVERGGGLLNICMCMMCVYMICI